MELYGRAENGIRAFEPIQESDYIWNAVYLFAAAVILQDLLFLGSLDFGMIILVFILMTFAPVLIDVITGWIKELYARSLDKETPGPIASFLSRLQNGRPL